MSNLTLEIVEGPGAGLQVRLDRPVVIGRDEGADIVLQDGEASRSHARVSPATDGSAVVEDLDSANGTFLNHNEVQGPARLDPGDELLIGVTVIEARSAQQVSAEPSAVRAVPAGLITAPRQPAYVSADILQGEAHGPGEPERRGQPELEKFLDVKVRRQAQLAPLALLTLIALALILYFGT